MVLINRDSAILIRRGGKKKDDWLELAFTVINEINHRDRDRDKDKDKDRGGSIECNLERQWE